MTVARLLCVARARGGGRTLLLLALAVALGTGMSLAAFAGARRTASAHEELLGKVNAFDLGIAVDAYDPAALAEELAAIDGVREVSQHSGFFDLVSPDLPADLPAYWLGPFGGQKTVDRAVVYEGRLGEAEDEVALNHTIAERTGLGVGDRLRVESVDAASGATVEEIELDVVGIMGLPEATIEDEADANLIVYLSPAFVEARVDRIAWGQGVVTVEEGRDAEVARSLADAGYAQDQDVEGLRRQAQDSVLVLAVALAGLGGLTALATVAVAVQWLVRLERLSAADRLALDAVGTVRRQRFQANALLALAVALPGAALGALLAYLASPLFPVGSLREVPLLRGTSFDTVVLIGGPAVFAAVVVVLTTTIVALTDRGPRRPAAVPVPLGPLASVPSAASGIRMGANRSRLLGVAGLVVAASAVMAVITFTASLNRLVADPALSGFTWDLLAKEPFSPLDHEAIEATIDSAEEVSRATGLGYVEARVNDRAVVASVWTSLSGTPYPPVVDGEEPSGARQLLMGERTLDDLDVEIGDTVLVEFFESSAGPDAVRVRTEAQEFTVVGTAVGPAIGIGGTDVPRLNDGIMVDGADLAELVPDAQLSGLFLFGLAEGTDPDEFRQATFPEGLPDEFFAATDWFTTATPSEVIEAASARPALVIGAGAVALVVIATIGHGLVGQARDGRRSYAVLSAIGFTPRQVRATILWQAGAVAAVVLVVAVPIGVALGRGLWRMYADRIGVVATPDTPMGAILATAALILLASVAAALIPAALAQRAGRAESLRTG